MTLYIELKCIIKIITQIKSLFCFNYLLNTPFKMKMKKDYHLLRNSGRCESLTTLSFPCQIFQKKKNMIIKFYKIEKKLIKSFSSLLTQQNYITITPLNVTLLFNVERKTSITMRVQERLIFSSLTLMTHSFCVTFTNLSLYLTISRQKLDMSYLLKSTSC